MRKITFPHMGNLFIIGKALFEELGFEVVIPPYNNKSALEIGKRLSPEFICLPFKLNMGNFIQAIEMGANTIVILVDVDRVDLDTMVHLKKRFSKIWAMM